SQIRQTNQETNSGPFVTALELQTSPQVGPEFTSRENAFTYLVTPQYKFSPDLMAYARVASGYRAGGPNPAFGVPPQYAPDKTYNYELGVKADQWDHKISFDASV